MAVTPRSVRTRSRTLAAASGLAALALVLGACGEEGEAEQAVGEATSAVGRSVDRVLTRHASPTNTQATHTLQENSK